MTETTPPKKKPSKLKTCLKATYIIVMAFYGIYGLIQAIMAYTKFRDLSKGYNNIIENWEEDIIIDITAADPGSTCPAGSSKEFVYNYGGANAGCDCRSVSHQDLSNTIYTGSSSTCNTTMIAAGCVQKDSWPSKECDSLASGTSSGNAKALCIHRKAGVDFIETASKLGSDGNCASGYTECGSSAASDVDRLNAFCVPNDVGGCPIMDITIGGTTPSPGSSLTIDSTVINWSKVPTSTKMPISELTLSVGNVCKNNNNNPKEATNVGNYPLRVKGKNTQISCEGGTDDTFEQFHSIKYTTFLAQNDAWPSDTKFTDLQNSYSTTEEMIFYKRSFIPLKK